MEESVYHPMPEQHTRLPQQLVRLCPVRLVCQYQLQLLRHQAGELPQQHQQDLAATLANQLE